MSDVARWAKAAERALAALADITDEESPASHVSKLKHRIRVVDARARVALCERNEARARIAELEAQVKRVRAALPLRSEARRQRTPEYRRLAALAAIDRVRAALAPSEPEDDPSDG